MIDFSTGEQAVICSERATTCKSTSPVILNLATSVLIGRTKNRVQLRIDVEVNVGAVFRSELLFESFADIL